MSYSESASIARIKPVKPKGFFASRFQIRSQRIAIKDELDLKRGPQLPASPGPPTVAPLVPLAESCPTLLACLEHSMGPTVNTESVDGTSMDARKLNNSTCEALIVTEGLRDDLKRLQNELQIRAAILEPSCSAWRANTAALGPGRIGGTLPLAYGGGMDRLSAGIIDWMLSRPEIWGPRDRNGECNPICFASTFKQHRAKLAVDFKYRKASIGEAGACRTHDASYQQGLDLLRKVHELALELDRTTSDMAARRERIASLDQGVKEMIDLRFYETPASPIHAIGRVMGQHGRGVHQAKLALLNFEARAKQTARDEAEEMWTSVRRELGRTVLASIKGHLLGATSFSSNELPSIFQRFAVLSFDRQLYPRKERALSTGSNAWSYFEPSLSGASTGTSPPSVSASGNSSRVCMLDLAPAVCVIPATPIAVAT